MRFANYTSRQQALFYHNIQVWEDARFQANLAMASVPGAKDKWAILTNEPPSLETFWQYGLRFRIEYLFLDSKSGAFQWQLSRVRSVERLERLYFVIAVATSIFNFSWLGCCVRWLPFLR